MDTLVFDERIEGLSESCIDLMRRLMHPNPEKRMTSYDFRRHPWVQGLTASWTLMGKAHAGLESFWQNRFRAEVMKLFADTTGGGTDSSSLSDHDLETMFKALDIKQNGVLEIDEIASAFKTVPEEQIRSIFSSADLDGTGVIRYDEFRALMGKAAEGGSDPATTTDGPGLQARYLQDRFKSHVIKRFGSSEQDAASDKDELRKIFNAIDLEGNGVLDAHDIRVVLRSAGEPEDVISRMVATLDKNHDGTVDWDEFQEIMGSKG
jgi:Ca2+-binding EF-hand superfamily protein